MKIPDDVLLFWPKQGKKLTTLFFWNRDYVQEWKN